jgi:hypothetical protein
MYSLLKYNTVGWRELKVSGTCVFLTRSSPSSGTIVTSSCINEISFDVKKNVFTIKIYFMPNLMTLF